MAPLRLLRVPPGPPAVQHATSRDFLLPYQKAPSPESHRRSRSLGPNEGLYQRVTENRKLFALTRVALELDTASTTHSKSPHGSRPTPTGRHDVPQSSGE